jgi:hypothetical protein
MARKMKRREKIGLEEINYHYKIEPPYEVIELTSDEIAELRELVEG